VTDRVVRIQPPFGRLTWEPQIHWWESDPIAVPLFSGAKTRISFQNESDDPAAPFNPNALAAASAFFALQPAALSEIEPHVWQEYVDIRDEFADEEGFPKIAHPEDLWRHVQLNGIGIDTRSKDGLVYVNIECNCDWEPEHGLQLVLQNGVRWARVSDYSGHFTEGDAYACPELDAWMQDPNGKLPVRSREETFALLGNFKHGRR
jgi:hypothetical protein